MADYNEWLEELSKRTGASVEQSDLERLGQTNPDDVGRLQDALAAQYQRRGESQTTGSGQDSTELTRLGYGSGRDETADDPVSGITRPGGGGGGSVAQAWLGSGGGAAGGSSAMFPDWYRQLLERQVANTEAESAERKQRADALFGQLQTRANQSLAIDRNDPIIRAQADAYGANEERARRNYVSDIAERYGPLANIRGEERVAAERVGQRTGAFEAELLGRELGARRAEIADALSAQGALLSGDQRAQLQAQLSLLDQAIAEQQIGLGYRGQDLDFALGREGLGVQRRGQDLGMDQFLRELALREWDRGQYWDYNWAGA